MIRVPEGYADPRLAATYDAENVGRADIDLATRGHRVTGIDPAAAMLEIARARPGGDRVTWILGDASAMPSGAADLVTMTGHVAQVFLTDDDWEAVLRHARRALRPGGHLAFGSRNPGARAWTGWTREASLGHYASDGGREFTSWVETQEVTDEIVRFEAVTVFEDTGETIVASDALRFRTEAELRASLTGAGFAEPEVSGAWDGSPVGPTSRELIVVAPTARALAETREEKGTPRHPLTIGRVNCLGTLQLSPRSRPTVSEKPPPRRVPGKRVVPIKTRRGGNLQ